MNCLNHTYSQTTIFTQHCGADTCNPSSDEQVQWTCEPKPSEFPTLMTKLRAEKDPETGLSYFGARYYEPEMLNIWLSVDPMADKYPNMSPYNYCAWNPVKLVDPDGRDVWKFDTEGNVTEHIENSDYDQFQVVDALGNECSSKQYKYGTIKELSLNDGNTYFKVNGDDNAKELFEFLAGEYNDDNDMPLEWSLVKLSNNNESNIIGTSHEEASTTIVRDLRKHYGKNTQFALRVHNHPAGSVFPDDSDMRSVSGEDCYLYTITNGYIQYNSKGRIDMPQSDRDLLYDYTIPQSSKFTLIKYTTMPWKDLR